MRKQIKLKLFELSDNEYQKFHKNLCPGTENIIGVRIPILRKYAKEIFDENNLEQLLKEIDDECYEEIMLKGMLIGLVKKQDINKILKYIEEYIPKINNWAICDTFCAGLKITKKYKKEVWKFIQKYYKSNKEFEIRFAIVMIIDYYIEENYIYKIFEIFDSIKNQNYYAKMAIAWAISICLVKRYDETIKYLENAKIDNWTFNKSIQKAIESYRISDGQKNILKKLKKY